MTDRVRALTVVLERDYRDDDIQPLMEAILHMKGVAHVEHDNHITDLNDFTARQRVRAEVADGMLDMVRLLNEGKQFKVVEDCG